MDLSLKHPTNRPNFTAVSIGEVTVWFSYETPIGFHSPGLSAVRENVWGPTTGKHINYVADHIGKRDKARLDGNTFVAVLTNALIANVAEDNANA